jgi:serine/threonine-protein kinase
VGAVEALDPKAGDVVDGTYALVREIAQGGMGIVFEAVHAHTKRHVALKLLLAEHRGTVEVRERLLREARVLGTVCHPGIVEVLDARVDTTFGPYVALELLEGRTLESIVERRGRISLEDAVQVGRQILEALSYAHACKIVHRDVKPANVFVVRDSAGREIVKLIDFGIAAEHGAPPDARRAKLTAVGGLLGTLHYMSLEQLLGQAVDARADLYAVASTLYECLAGRTPFTGEMADVVRSLAIGATPRPLTQIRDDVPAEVVTVIEQALAAKASARTPDAATFIRGLMRGARLRSGARARRGLHASDSPPPAGSIRPPEADRPDAAEPVVLARRSEPIELRRRRSPRVPYVTPAQIGQPGGARLMARIDEVSETGLQLVAGGALAEGETVAVRFALPWIGESAEVVAIVRWTRPSGPRTIAGLELRHPPANVLAALGAYVRGVK